MPERAAETRQVPDDTREELIAKAAELWTTSQRHRRGGPRRRRPAGGPGPGGR